METDYCGVCRAVGSLKYTYGIASFGSVVRPSD